MPPLLARWLAHRRAPAVIDRPGSAPRRLHVARRLLHRRLPLRRVPRRCGPPSGVAAPALRLRTRRSRGHAGARQAGAIPMVDRSPAQASVLSASVEPPCSRWTTRSLATRPSATTCMLWSGTRCFSGGAQRCSGSRCRHPCAPILSWCSLSAPRTASRWGGSRAVISWLPACPHSLGWWRTLPIASADSGPADGSHRPVYCLAFRRRNGAGHRTSVDRVRGARRARNVPLRARLARLAIPGGIVIAYLVAYKLGDFGSARNAAYIEPLSDSVRFVGAMLARPRSCSAR